MELFLGYFLVHWGVIVIAEKYNIRKAVQRFARWSGIKLFYDMSECKFCIDHHIGFLLVVPIAIYDFKLVYIVFAFMSSSLINIVINLKK